MPINNSVRLIGELGNDLTLRQTSNGGVIGKVNILTKERWMDADTGLLGTHIEWHRLVFWNSLATNTAKYMGKGSKVAIVGRLRNHKRALDGETSYITEVHVDEVEFLSAKAPGRAKKVIIESDDGPSDAAPTEDPSGGSQRPGEQDT
jgi:single-strand DNA-binding protein